MASDIQKEHTIETYKSLISISLEGMKVLLLLNGGALVALMAYLSNIKKTGDQVPDLLWALIFFSIGLVCCALTIFFSYMTQLRLFQESRGQTSSKSQQEESQQEHKFWLNCGLAMALASVTSFAIGAISAILKLS
jgi:hypothetical protein